MRVRSGGLAVAVALLAGCSSGPSHPHTTASQSPPGSLAQQQRVDYPSPSACPSVTASPGVKVTLTDIEGRPTVSVRLHTTFEVVIHGQAKITTPLVTPPQAVCLVHLSPSGTTRTATYYALKPGQVIIAATITGVPGAINHPGYVGRFNVR